MENEVKGNRKQTLVIVIPIFNDWEALELLIQRMDPIISRLDVKCTLVIVNDGSTLGYEEKDLIRNCNAICSIKVLSLLRNLGHQRAITIGLAYVHENIPDALTLVMDGDGEDDPENIPQLIEACYHDNLSKIVFAERVKRMEGPLFRTFYHLYRFFHLLVTGLPVRVGNYSVIPFSCLKRLSVVSEMWNHYAAAVLKAKIPLTTIPTIRATRLLGQPKMNFVSLVIHGLSAISIYGAIAGVRVLICITILLIICLLAGVISLVAGLGMGAASSVFFAVAGMLFLVMVTMTVFILLILARRTDTSFLPIRDYKYFVDEMVDLGQ